jgi:hypothetical protein
MIHNNYIYKIDKEPYETDENTYMRGWYIINSDNNEDNYDEIISQSIININEIKNKMKYNLC